MSLNINLLVWHKKMIRNNISKLIESGVDLGLDNISKDDLMLIKLEPLSALVKALPNSILHDAVRHN
jgi:hypothetical protein